VNHRTRTALLGAVLALALQSPCARAGDDPAAAVPVTAFRAGRIVTGAGTVIENGVILVKNGRIAAIGEKIAIPAGARQVKLEQRVLIPGLVNPLTYLAAGGRDDDESVTPDVLAADGVDLFARNRSLLAGGITTTYVAPGRRRLVSGLGAVVLTAGPAEERLLRAMAGLRINLGERSKNPPALFEPPVPPTAEHGLAPARRQAPTSRPGARLEILRTFRAAREHLQATERARSGQGPRPRRNLALEALAPVLRGEIPVRINAHRAADILGALDLGRELEREGMRVKLIVVGATEACRVADLLAEAEVPVVLNGAVYPGQAYDRDDTRDDDDGRADLRNAARLVSRGVRVALYLPRSVSPADLLLGAAYAARCGMPPEKALQAITLEAARVSGVADQVGSLEAGKRADFVVLDRDPFDARARPLAVYCGGRRVYRRTADRPPADIIAVRAGRVLTMAGRTLERATVLIENGKIVDIGAAVTVPSTARVIDVPDGVVTPGFIDTASHVGLHTDRLNVTPAPATPAAAPRGPRPRPGARPPRRPRRPVSRGVSLTLKDNLVDVIEPGDPGFEALLRAGVTSVIVTPPGTSVTKLAAIKLGARDRDELVLRRVAAIRYPMLLRDSASRKEAAGKLESTLKRAKAYLEKLAKYEKELAAYRKAKAEAEAGDEAEKKAAAKLKEPKKPSEDENHEAWRAVLEKRAAVVVPIGREDTITAALEVFGKFDLKPVLEQATEAHRVVEAVKAGAAGLLAGPPFIVREPDGAPVFNARRLADAGVPVAFYTGGTSGAKFLPLHAAYAVREGLSREAALAGLTTTPARLFHIHDRVGSLEVGKDGDLVVFSGDPFDLTARVQVVVAAGRVVHDARKGVR